MYFPIYLLKDFFLKNKGSDLDELFLLEAYSDFENITSIHLLNKNNYILIPNKKDADVPGNLVFDSEIES